MSVHTGAPAIAGVEARTATNRAKGLDHLFVSVPPSWKSAPYLGAGAARDGHGRAPARLDGRERPAPTSSPRCSRPTPLRTAHGRGAGHGRRLARPDSVISGRNISVLSCSDRPTDAQRPSTKRGTALRQGGRSSGQGSAPLPKRSAASPESCMSRTRARSQDEHVGRQVHAHLTLHLGIDGKS